MTRLARVGEYRRHDNQHKKSPRHSLLHPTGRMLAHPRVVARRLENRIVGKRHQDHAEDDRIIDELQRFDSRQRDYQREHQRSDPRDGECRDLGRRKILVPLDAKELADVVARAHRGLDGGTADRGEHAEQCDQQCLLSIGYEHRQGGGGQEVREDPARHEHQHADHQQRDGHKRSERRAAGCHDRVFGELRDAPLLLDGA